MYPIHETVGVYPENLTCKCLQLHLRVISDELTCTRKWKKCRQKPTLTSPIHP
jgi:hypothetical protein